MKNLIVIIGTCVVLFIACVLVLMPLELGETQSEVSFIKMLPVDWNPYQRLYDEMLYPTVRISSANGVGSGVIIHHKGTKGHEVHKGQAFVNFVPLVPSWWIFPRPPALKLPPRSPRVL